MSTSQTDNYFLQPDYKFDGSFLTRSTLGVSDLSQGYNWYKPYPLVAGNTDPNFLTINVPAQLPHRKFYFSWIIDGFGTWDIAGEIQFMLNQSPILTWPVATRDVATRVRQGFATGVLFPTDTINPPFWIDNQIVNPADVPPILAQRQSANPINQSLNTVPLALCPQMNQMDSMWYNVSASLILAADDTTNVENYYTVVMFPSHFDLTITAIRFNLTRINFTLDTPGGSGIFYIRMACRSDRFGY
jgi:hypothetical protein